MADTAHDLQFDQFLPHQPQASALSFLWLLSTQQRDQVGFGLAIQFPLVGRAGWGRRTKAASSPCSRKRVRTRSTVLLLTANASMIWAVDQPGPLGPRSICNTICACRIWLAGATPLFVRLSKARCCPSLHVMLLLVMQVSLSGVRLVFQNKNTSFFSFPSLVA
jgi:hypothetical protein